MKLTYSILIVLFSISFFLIFYVTDIDLRYGSDEPILLNKVSQLWTFFSSGISTSEHNTQSFMLTENNLRQSLLILSVALSILASSLATYNRVKFGKNRIYIACLFTAALLSYVAIESGFYIGVFRYA
jgi:hypothetical protein